MRTPHIPRFTSRRDFLMRAGGGFGALALSALLQRDDRATAATLATNPFAPRPAHHDAQAPAVILVSGSGVFFPSNFVVAGNFIGTNATGSAAAGNKVGIQVVTGEGTIGGSAAADRNIISGNVTDGIYVTGDNALNIYGNAIGGGADGTTPLGNGHDGVMLDHTPTQPTSVRNVSIGSADGRNGNVIAFNANLFA